MQHVAVFVALHHGVDGEGVDEYSMCGVEVWRGVQATSAYQAV